MSQRITERHATINLCLCQTKCLKFLIVGPARLRGIRHSLTHSKFKQTNVYKIRIMGWLLHLQPILIKVYFSQVMDNPWGKVVEVDATWLTILESIVKLAVPKVITQHSQLLRQVLLPLVKSNRVALSFWCNFQPNSRISNRLSSVNY
jgi:hypothetical protein